MANSGSFTTTAYSGKRSITFNWAVQSQNIAGNYTIISWNFVGSGTNSGTWYGTKNGYLNINGARVYTGSSSTMIQLDVGTVLASGTTTIYHNNDGTKTFSADGGATIYNYGVYQTGSGSWTLPTIPRKAITTSAQDFTDEQDPKISFTNDGGFSLVPYINFYDSTNTLVFSIRRSKGTYSSPYTFTLTNTERNNMRSTLNTQKTYTVYEGVETYNGNTSLGYSSIGKTFSIVNANPTFEQADVTYADVNSSVVAITGNNQKIVQNKSSVSVTYAGATALKGATITGYSFKLNGVIRTSSSAGGTVSFGAVDSAQNLTLTATVTDSRGNTTTVEKTVTMLAYQNPSAIISLARVNNYEDTTKLKVDGSISSVDSRNVMTIKYKKKQSGGSYGALTTLTDNVEITTICDKNYEWIFYISVTDSFSSSFTTEVTLPKGKFPLFIDTVNNAVGINEFPNSGEAMRVADGIAVFEDGIKIGTSAINDFVVEQGTYNGWTYRKWNSGTMEEWTIITPTFTSWSTWGNNYWYQSSAAQYNFGVSFSNQPVLNVSNFSNSWAIPMTQSISNSGFTIYGVRPTAGTTVANAYYYSVYAVGRWQ